MAKKRDVVIAVIIIGFFVIAIGMFGLMFLGLASQDDGLEFGGSDGGFGIPHACGIMLSLSSRYMRKPAPIE